MQYVECTVGFAVWCGNSSDPCLETQRRGFDSSRIKVWALFKNKNRYKSYDYVYEKNKSCSKNPSNKAWNPFLAIWCFPFPLWFLAILDTMFRAVTMVNISQGVEIWNLPFLSSFQASVNINIITQSCKKTKHTISLMLRTLNGVSRHKH